MSLNKLGALLSIALGMAASMLSACSRSEPAPARIPEVGIISVEAQAVPISVELPGRTSAFLVSEVRPQVSGIIQARLFEEGAYVDAGQILYQIDSASYQAAYDSAKAQLRQAEASYNAAKATAARYETLAKKGVVSLQNNEDIQAAYQEAAAAVAVQKAAVAQAQINLDYTKVVAPISGHIGRSSVTPGALVTALQAAPLTTIQDLSKIYVDVSQSASDLLKLRRSLAAGRLDMPVSAQVGLILDDGTTYPIMGSLEFSDVSVDPGTGAVLLRALFDNPDGTLLPGMYVRAVLTQGVATKGILIPQGAVSRSPDGEATVMIAKKTDSTVEQRTITVTQTIGDHWLVSEGLALGEEVIVEGLQRIRPGMQVKPTSTSETR